MNDIAEQLAKRDRFQRHRQHAMTPAGRMAAMRRLQRKSWEMLSNSPEGLRRLMARNFKARSISWRENDAGRHNDL